MNRCPRDRETLASNDVDGYRYYSCEWCGGYWVPGGALDRVLSARGVGELRAVAPVSASELRCPDCHSVCAAIEISGCKLDTCAKCHGVWLDAGEVRRVRNLFPEGSAVVDADASRIGKEDGSEAALSFSLVDLVGNFLLMVLR